MPMLIVLSFVGCMVWGIASAVGSYLDMPDVHKSYLTQQCVRVVTADGTKLPCPEVLPDRYHLVWVE